MGIVMVCKELTVQFHSRVVCVVLVSLSFFFFPLLSVVFYFYDLPEDWETSIPPAVWRRQLPKHSSLRGTACVLHHSIRTVFGNVCEYKLQSLSMQNMSLLLAEQKTCSHVMLWPSSLLKRILLLSFVDLCTPVLIQRKMRLESGGQNYSGLMPKSKEHDMGGAQGSTFWWNLFFFPIYIYEHFILLPKKKKNYASLHAKKTGQAFDCPGQFALH